MFTKKLFSKTQTQKSFFGFSPSPNKQKQINSLFTRVSQNYDLMNNVMSFGMHTCWKKQLVQEIGILSVEGKRGEAREKIKVLDVASGSGDVAIELYDF